MRCLTARTYIHFIFTIASNVYAVGPAFTEHKTLFKNAKYHGIN
jgi:hypothetical protein